MRTTAAALGLGVICIAAASPASAATILPAGGSFVIDFKGTEDNVNSGPFLPWLTSTATFTVGAWVGDTVTVTVDLENTTDTAAGYGSVITSFGFLIDPDVVSAGSSASGLFSTILFDAGISAHGLGTYIGGDADLCVTNNANCAGGNPNNGLAAGNAGTVTLTLQFASTPTSLTFDQFFVRYQALTFNGQDYLSGSGAGIPCTGLDDEDCYPPPPPCEGQDCDPPGDTIPEPAMLALFGVSLLGAGFARRRR